MADEPVVAAPGDGLVLGHRTSDGRRRGYAAAFSDVALSVEFWTSVLGLARAPFPAATQPDFRQRLQAAAGIPAPTGGMWVDTPERRPQKAELIQFSQMRRQIFPTPCLYDLRWE
jgi:hypothetical protein